MQSCGYSVPFFEFKRHRTQLVEYFHKSELNDIQAETNSVCDTIDPKGIRAYWTAKNSKSIDGLPGLTNAPQSTATHVHSVSALKPVKAGAVQGTIHILDPRLALGFALGALFTVLCMKLLGVRVYMSGCY